MKKGNVKMLIRNLREMEETKQYTIPSVIKRFKLEDELLSVLWEAKTWFENNPTGNGGYSENYCKEKLKNWMADNVL